MKIANSELPKILSLRPEELIDWCNKRKKEMHISNAKLSQLTNVPEGTLDRIFTGKNPEFRYSTIQPIVRYLIGIEEETPENENNEYYSDTIEGYKLIVENKNYIIEELKHSYIDLQRQCADKQAIIDDMFKHVEWLEGIIDEVKKQQNNPKTKKPSKK